LNEKSSGSRSRKQRLTAVGARCADDVTPLYPQKLALTSPTGGGRSVGIVRVRTKATCVCVCVVCVCLYVFVCLCVSQGLDVSKAQIIVNFDTKLSKLISMSFSYNV